MEVVLAGDIIGSQKNSTDDYLKIIEPILEKYSKKGMYQIYRGDSFQAWLEKPQLALFVSIKIKAALKRNGLLDVRIAIGLGVVNLIEKNIAKSNGSALTRSGVLLDSLKDIDQDLMVDSGHPLDKYMNTTLQIALIYMNEWTENGASTIFESLNNPGITQKELGAILGVKQATASRRLDRAHQKETDLLLNLFIQYYKDVRHAAIN